MKLLVGLGNPGKRYARNRHNVGFMAIDRIAEHHRIGPWKKRFQGQAADGEIAGSRVLLLKPETYMNESGRAVGEAARFLKIPLGDIVVLYDEIDLAPGKLKVKTGGGNAGHNGLRSISHLVGNEYQRVRIGIGHPGVKELVTHHVLNDFAKADAEWLEPLLDAIAACAGRLATGDEARFLTDVALKLADANRTEAEATAAPSPPPSPRGTGGHPAGERAAKRKGALAANLEKWLKGRKATD